MKIQKISVDAWDVPMRAPYRSAQRVTTTARNVLVRVTLSDGTVGYGESAPATYVTGETQDSVIAALGTAIADGGGEGFSGTAEELIEALRRRVPHVPGGFSALATALLDAEARQEGLPFFRKLGGEANGPFTRRTDLSLPILTPEQAGDRAARAAAEGFGALKIKVGSGDAAADAASVRAVAVAAPTVTLRLDGNQGFTAQAAVDFLELLSELIPRIEMFEQPTKAGDDAAMAFVARRIPIPVFADESVHSPEDAARLVGAGAASGVVLKLAKADPLTLCAIARAAYAAGGRCLFGCMMETGVAITAALQAAAALGAEIVPMLDLDGRMLVDDTALVIGGSTMAGDRLTVDPAQAGLGVTARIAPEVSGAA